MRWEEDKRRTDCVIALICVFVFNHWLAPRHFRGLACTLASHYARFFLAVSSATRSHLMDRTLTYHWHLDSLRDNLTSRVALLRPHADSGWGAGATVLWTATLALVYSTAKYCTPAWFRSAHTHLIDLAINDALRTVTGGLRHTPANKVTLYWVTSSIPHARRLNLSKHRSNMENANTWRKTRIHTWR